MNGLAAYWQWICTLVLVVGAAALLLRRAVGLFRPARPAGCGACAACPVGQQEPPTLVHLDVRPDPLPCAPHASDAAGPNA